MPKIKNLHTDGFKTRVDKVVIMLQLNTRYLSNSGTTDLVKSVKKTFNCCERTAYTYISHARKFVLDVSQTRSTSKEAFTRAVRDLEYLRLTAKKNKDYSLLLAVVKEIGRLWGLYPKKQINKQIQITKYDFSKMTEEQLEKMKRGILFKI